MQAPQDPGEPEWLRGGGEGASHCNRFNGVAAEAAACWHVNKRCISMQRAELKRDGGSSEFI